MRKNPKIDRLIQLTRETTRTPLFWLLHDHYDQLSETWRGNRVRWPVVCGWVAACGITDKHGRPLQPGAVKMTWRRVCAAKGEEQAAKPAPAPVRSPTVSRAPAMPQPAPAQAIPSAEERVAKLQETIYRRSGRSWPPSEP
jgi:hypothetical protein